MTFQDFNARAELYLGSDHISARAQGGRQFRSAANALRFALEEAAPVSLRGASLVVGNRSFSPTEMSQLYGAANYPLPRKAVSRVDGPLKFSNFRRGARSQFGHLRQVLSGVGERIPALP